MKTTTVSPAEQLKAELMERYGLRADQVNIQVNIYTSDLALGKEILSDYDVNNESEWKKEYFNYPKCDNVSAGDIKELWVHRKDGFYGTYEGEEDES